MTGIAFHNPAALHDPSPFGYSHVARVSAGHDLLLIAGQGGFAPDLSMSSDFRDQMRQAIANLTIALTANGASLADVARTTLLIVDYGPDVFAIMAEELALAWPDAKPASTLIPVERLALPGMLIEIEATATLAVPI
jgi:enamine deaminase RidA (YjgF/YER057c/UK114 family)